jgi:creatinine amidohydrolase
MNAFTPITRSVFVLLAFVVPLWGQVRPLHTRDLTRLSQVQVAEQLKKNDIVFIPVGAVETNGIMPSDRDYVTPLGYAMTMAEETGGLYMPGLVWSYPGTTRLAAATIYMSPEQGVAHLKILAHSLLQQGFRRQVYISSGQGPAVLTVGTLVRSFFEECQVPILYLDMNVHFPKLKLGPEVADRVMYGARYLAGRIEDIPLQGDYAPVAATSGATAAKNPGQAALGKLGYSGSVALGSWNADVMDHDGARGKSLPSTAAEREEWGKLGAAQLKVVVKKMRMPEAMEALREHDRFTQKVVVPKFREMAPNALPIGNDTTR